MRSKNQQRVLRWLMNSRESLRPADITGTDEQRVALARYMIEHEIAPPDPVFLGLPLHVSGTVAVLSAAVSTWSILLACGILGVAALLYAPLQRYYSRRMRTLADVLLDVAALREITDSPEYEDALRALSADARDALRLLPYARS